AIQRLLSMYKVLFQGHPRTIPMEIQGLKDILGPYPRERPRPQPRVPQELRASIPHHK
ncbi:hypothetical protein BGX29_008083, partial [Mortierella sp. GBA35]